MKTLMITLLMIFIHSTGFAIINFQEHMLDKKDGFKLGINGTLSQRKTLTELIIYGLDGFIKFKANKHFILVVGSYHFGESTSNNQTNRIINNNAFHIRYKYQIINKLGIEIFAQREFNEFLRFENRILLGVGPRFTILESKTLDLNLGTAYMFEFNEFTQELSSKTFSDSGKKTNTSRLASYLSLHIAINESLKLFSTLFYQPAFEDFSNYRLLSENILIIDISKIVFLKLSYILTYDSIPAETVGNKSTKLFIGPGIKLSF